jgi:hypothetical protein
LLVGFFNAVLSTLVVAYQGACQLHVSFFVVVRAPAGRSRALFACSS